jgi:hypothetical protein
VASRGLRFAARCSAPCRLDAQLYVADLAARRLGLGRGARSLLVGSAELGLRAPGTVPLTVALRPSARAALGRAAAVTLELRVRARDATGVATRTRSYQVTLRRTGRSPLVAVASARTSLLSVF